MFCRRCSFSPRVLGGPSTNRLEALPHDRKLAEFNNVRPKIRGGSPPPQKKIGAKTCRISVNFGPLQTLIANISGTRQHIKNRKDVRTTAIPPAFKEKSPVNFGSLTIYAELYVSLDPLKCTFWDTIYRPCALKFLHALEIWRDYLAHTRTGTGVSQKNLIVKINNLA